MLKRLLLLVSTLTGVVLVSLLAAWTQNSDTIHLRGAVYTGTSKVALTNATGNLATTSGAFSGALSASGDTTLGDSLSLTDLAAGVTASTGSAQGDGPITVTATQITTAASAGDAVTLPSAVAGLVQIVCNHAAANAADVFPASGDQINNVTANAAVSLAAGECMQCIAFSASRWGCVIGSAT